MMILKKIISVMLSLVLSLGVCAVNAYAMQIFDKNN